MMLVAVRDQLRSGMEKTAWAPIVAELEARPDCHDITSDNCMDRLNKMRASWLKSGIVVFRGLNPGDAVCTRAAALMREIFDLRSGGKVRRVAVQCWDR